MQDLYKVPLNDLTWTKLCGGNTGDQSDDDTESCVEIAPLPGVDDAFALRDSKNHSAGTLLFTGDELAAFAARFASAS